MTKCTFNKAWIGQCGAEDCQEHADVKCVSCGQPATHECSETFQFVCGAPLCDDCEHEIAPDGTNGGNFKHVKKSEQKHLPWYARAS